MGFWRFEQAELLRPSVGLGRVFRAHEVGIAIAAQQSDDGYHDHDLHQGEASCGEFGFS